jgi:murein DD-endopeptidase MepM/ murein hydrolase activator NlpD
MIPTEYDPDDPLHQRPGSLSPEKRIDPPSEAVPDQASPFELIWGQLARWGLAEPALRLGTHALTILAVLLVVWGASEFFQQVNTSELQGNPVGVQAAEIPTATPTPLPPQLAPLPDMPVYGRLAIRRQVIMNTGAVGRNRQEIITYTVQEGDNLFAIAEKFGLSPETVLWGNFHMLADDPHNLRPGQELNILPVDGTLYEWQPGDGLNAVARFFGITPEEIIGWPGNNLDPATIGDYAHPNIETGTMLVIPGGRREFVTWSVPRITREEPAVAQVLGSGSCSAVTSGPVGMGAFIWPANNHFISGYDFAPAANHYGIDIDGDLGDAVYAADGGVVVYSGWNDWGYGNMVVIDHGNGWQSLYAHLNAMNVDCGSFVNQGDLIGAFGSTGNSSGPHLHFELLSDQYGKVNPWNFLP